MRITAKEPVSLTNENVKPTIYQPGEFYAVAPHIAESMFLRSWAEPVSKDAIPVAAAGPGDAGTIREGPSKPQGPQPRPGQPQEPPPKPDDKGGDKDGKREAPPPKR